MKVITKIALASIWVSIGLSPSLIAHSQSNTNEQSDSNSAITEPATLPTVVNSQPPTVQSNQSPNPNTSTSTISVKCENLTTVVQKGERKASMLHWETNYFGEIFTPEKRCQLVSARLQAAADRNGGTFKNLQFGSGILNRQTVICLLQSGDKNCTTRNILLTLKPENAQRPQAIIAKILIFAKNGSTTINESARIFSKSSLNLGNWELQAFPKSATSVQNTDMGF
jgi:Circadian oscillating protein COP23